MGSAINLEKLKRVCERRNRIAEASNTRGKIRVAKLRPVCFSEVPPEKRSTLFVHDDLLDRIGSGIIPPTAKRKAQAPLRQPREASPSAKRIVCEGKCLTIAEWAEAIGVAEPTIRYRLSHGWTEEEAVTYPKLMSRAKPKPRTKDSALSDLAAQHGMSRRILVEKLCSGLSLADALRPNSDGALEHEHNGTGGWVEPSADDAGTGGVGSRDTASKQDFFQ